MITLLRNKHSKVQSPNPAQLRVPRQDEANVTVFVRPSIDAFEGEPGLSPDLRLLHLHPTLLKPRWHNDLMRTPTLTLPPLNPIALRDSREDVDGVCSDPTRPLHHQSKRARQRQMSQATKQADKPRSDAFEGEPGFSPDLHLHPTLLKPRRNDDSMRTLTPTLHPLNPIALCDSQQDVDGVCSDLTGPLHHKSKSKNARKRVMRQAMKQADKQRRESAPDLFLDGLEDDLVLGGALLMVDAFAIYRWSPERRLWMPVRVQVMMVQPPRLGPGAGFLEVPASPRRSSSCWSLCLRDLPCVPRLRRRCRCRRGCSQRREQRRRPPASQWDHQRRRLGDVRTST